MDYDEELKADDELEMDMPLEGIEDFDPITEDDGDDSML